jgi:ABC-type nitrate/sulfonate/bicarbonate transport system substrate-binding protein
MRHFLSFAIIAVLCFVYTPVYSSEKLIVDYGGHAGFQSAVWVAKDLKIFDKYGLDVDVIMITGSARSIAALLGGSTQFATGSATGPLAAAAKGSDVKLLAASYNKFPYAFVAKSEIHSPKDLRGKKVNILNYGGSNDFALQLSLKEWGLKLSDIKVIVGGDSPTRLASLMTGRTDATVLAPPHLLIAIKNGYRVLGDMGDMSAHFSQSALSTTGSFLKQNRDTVKRFLKAYSEAIYKIKTDREDTIKIFAKRMRVDDRETLNATYDYFAPRFSLPPRVNLEGIRETLNFYAKRYPEFRNRQPQEFVDNSLLDELEKEGFFKNMGR